MRLKCNLLGNYLEVGSKLLFGCRENGHITNYVINLYTVLIIHFATSLFSPFLHQIFIKSETQEQFWNLLVVRIPKLPQIVEFDEDLAELLKVKHT